MVSALKIREARIEELTAIVKLMVEAFRGRAMNEAFFPERLRTGSGDDEEVAFRVENLAKRFDFENHHYIVVVDNDDNILGAAEWLSGDDPVVAMTEEERAANKAKGMAGLPKGFDFAAAEQAGTEAAELDKSLRDALGEEAYKNSWILNGIAVDPSHQRKGIGQMLMEWGVKRAEKESKNIRFLSSPSGAKMYRALGYEEVGSGKILGGIEYAFIKRAG